MGGGSSSKQTAIMGVKRQEGTVCAATRGSFIGVEAMGGSALTNGIEGCCCSRNSEEEVDDVLRAVAQKRARNSGKMEPAHRRLHILAAAFGRWTSFPGSPSV